MLPQYHSASCRRSDGSTMLEAAAADSHWVIRSWDNVRAPRSCLTSDPDRLRTAGGIADDATNVMRYKCTYDVYSHFTSAVIIITLTQNKRHNQ